MIKIRFEWDEEKARDNWLEHRISFENAQIVFLDPNRITEADRRFEYGEERYITLGMAKNLLLLVVGWTERGNDDTEIIRIISARKAEPHERRLYGNRKLHTRRT